MKTQYEKVKNHLLENGQITTWDAISKYRITRLSQYILMLRRKGYEIETEMKYTSLNNYALYKLK